MKVVVGCPVWRREWVLGAWFDHVETACTEAGVTPIYAFTLDRRDYLSRKVIEEHCAGVERDLHLVVTDEDQDQFREDKRDWSLPRIHHLVWVRNLLLEMVRKLSPDFFLSVDSDVLLAPSVVAALVENTEKFDAVGGKCYMTPLGRFHPSYAILLNRTGLLREDCDAVIPADVIMALKLMTPSAYRVDYRFHALGEDIGWSEACTSRGLEIGWDGRTCSKHVMTPDDLTKVDERCGY